MAMIWMLAASLLFALMGVCVKLGAAKFDATQMAFFRGCISLLLVYAGMRLLGRSPLTPHWRTHIMRSLAGFISLLCYFVAIARIPLATAVTLNYTSPLFMALLVVFWQREPVGRRLSFTLLCGFLGVILLLRPNWQADLLWGNLAGLGSGLISSIAYLHVRRLGEMGEPAWRTVFWFSLVTTLGSLPWMGSIASLQAIDAEGALLLFGIGGLGALAQLCMTQAYKAGRTLVVANLAYTTVLFSTSLAWWLWDEALPLPALLGMGLIVFSGVVASGATRRFGL